ncbi:MAG: Uncharacterized protein LiPW16_143 [Microgenomates group bacterium LiPW_16]|nr:MAG: Uncharacterized protein LiPW16_143 [Microgenomates group bacterium LiPW_16]
MRRCGFLVLRSNKKNTIDAVTLAQRLDVVILVSGDGDFLPLVEYLRRNTGCKVEIIAFGKSASKKLIEEADEFVNLDKASGKFLIKPHARL